ncbi:hypothetical protein [Paenibacillus lautus]|uniref:hypothetical protein n=1 Tax=Paenibacillus lautus TaxID=1401 RepID=UPI000BBDC2D9|nr:hypothetical protein [Paenibacillus lautus]PCL91876.1 hypothetical protein CPZ30_14095 [Paenibacillus lautus]
MSTRTHRLSKTKLNTLFVNSLGDAVLKAENINDKPLLLDLRKPYPLRLRVYLYNCTNPPGGRALDEYKIQVIVPNQGRGTRGNFDYSDGRMALLAAYVSFSDEITNGVFVLWDAMKHVDFSYSANIQVKSETIIEALCIPVSKGIRGNDEVVLAARSQHLLSAIKMRIDLISNDIQEATFET